MSMKRTYTVLRSYPTATSEFWGGVFSVAWGFFVLSPEGHKGFSNPAYQEFREFLPHEIWASTAVIFGFLQLYAMNRLKPGWRMTAAIALMFLWSFITIFAVLSADGIICIPFYAGMAVKEFWVTIRAAPPPHKDLPFAPKREEDLGGPEY